MKYWCNQCDENFHKEKLLSSWVLSQIRLKILYWFINNTWLKGNQWFIQDQYQQYNIYTSILAAYKILRNSPYNHSQNAVTSHPCTCTHRIMCTLSQAVWAAGVPPLSGDYGFSDLNTPAVRDVGPPASCAPVLPPWQGHIHPQMPRFRLVTPSSGSAWPRQRCWYHWEISSSAQADFDCCCWHF